jgi:hypothetical protein
MHSHLVKYDHVTLIQNASATKDNGDIIDQ